EGAIGTPPRLQLAKDAFEKSKTLGYDGDYYVDQYHAFDKYLKEKKFDKAFPSLDDLCLSFGNNAMYYQGRIIENIRISNTVDGYVVNGWENTKIENHSGVVDIWRNPKGNPAIMAKYNQPLYIAVKIRNKVLAVGDTTNVDFFIINEKNIKGKAQLQVQIIDDANNIIQENTYPVNISGGNMYGELLKENYFFVTKTKGYKTISAKLLQNNQALTTGSDQIFAADLHPEKITTPIAINDTSGTINKIFNNSHIPYFDLKNKMDFKQKIIVLAGGNDAFLKNTWQNHNDFLEWVADGNVAICLKGSEAFCEFLEKKEVLDYYGSQKIGTVWYGGNFFNKTHPFFNDLPANTAFNWEYQCFAAYNKERVGLRLKGEEAVVGTYADHRKEMFTSVAIIPVGRGKIIVSTLDFANAIGKENSPSAAVAKKLLENYLLYAQNWINEF
nr:hypothetical protein [Pseudarcicella sp.]